MIKEREEKGMMSNGRPVTYLDTGAVLDLASIFASGAVRAVATVLGGGSEGPFVIPGS